MTDGNGARGVTGAALGLVTILLLAADTIARIAPDRIPVAGHARLGEAIVAIAVPALFLVFGRLSAGRPDIIIGLTRATLVRGLLAVFVFALAARIIDSSTYGVDPMLALAASLYWPDGTFTVLPGLALCLLAAPRLSTARPFFTVGLAVGLYVSHVSTGIVLIDAAAANAVFFVLGLIGHRQIDGFIGAVNRERGAVLLCAIVLVAVDLLVASLGVARAPVMRLVLGAAGIAVVLAFAAELRSTRLGTSLTWLGTNALVALIGIELPLALLGRGPAGSTSAVLAMLGLAIAATIGLAAFAEWSARRSARAFPPRRSPPDGLTHDELRLSAKPHLSTAIPTLSGDPGRQSAATATLALDSRTEHGFTRVRINGGEVGNSRLRCGNERNLSKLR